MVWTDPDTQHKILNRLRRARGQLDGLIDTIEKGKSAGDAITQLAAVSSALDKAGFTMLSATMKDCLTNPEGVDDHDRLTSIDLEKLFLMLA